MTADEASALAAEAFVFGYPLVMMDVSREVMLSVPGPAGRKRANEFDHIREFPDPAFTSVVSPNADTLYSAAWLDLAAEPVVLSVPDSGGRYYLMPMLSGWTDVFASPGTRTTGNGPGTFAVTGPDWRGTLPDGVTEIRSPTAVAWLIGRTQTNGPADYENVRRFQDGLSLRPLSAWRNEPAPASAATASGAAADAPPTGPNAPPDAPPAPPPDQVAAMDAAAFFGRLGRLMVDNPPATADAPALERFAAIGLAPGSFQPDPDLSGALDEGVRAGLARIQALAQHLPGLASGWSVALDLGRYDTRYDQRAFVALFGLGANLADDAIYPHTGVDGTGQPLHGGQRYVLHFAPGQTPPARAFWSLTMYNERQYLVSNPMDRYAIGDRDKLAFNGDGSLDIWLQHETPGPDREPNWLPSPTGSFNLILRIYWPEPSVIDGSWAPPPVERL